MIKLLKHLIPFVSIALLGNVNAMETKITIDEKAKIPTIHAKTDTLSARYIEEGDIQDISTIAFASYPEGLPADVKKWASNLVDRRNGGNWYSCLVVNNLKNQPLAAIGYGRMPTSGYEPNEKLDISSIIDIMDTYLDFGIIKKINSSGSGQEQEYAKENFERIDNFGLGVMLPMVPTNLSEEQKIEILQLGTSVFQFLKDKEFVLPIEKTVPHDLIGLFHPDDSIVEIFKAIKFSEIKKKGFFGFYDKERVMVHKVL